MNPYGLRGGTFGFCELKLIIYGCVTCGNLRGQGVKYFILGYCVYLGLFGGALGLANI